MSSYKLQDHALISPTQWGYISFDWVGIMATLSPWGLSPIVKSLSFNPPLNAVG